MSLSHQASPQFLSRCRRRRRLAAMWVTGYQARRLQNLARCLQDLVASLEFGTPFAVRRGKFVIAFFILSILYVVLSFLSLAI